ncbi:MAG TPA: hypothetical protein DCZ74_03475 [Treponema sp.]|nr:hypothetical protein [Treponema sp.]
MACFMVPLAEAVVVSAVKALIGSKKTAEGVIAESKENSKIASVKEKIGWLQKLLLGGSGLLAIEHIYHGEIVLYPPFLTAMRNPSDIPEMLHEMATVGVGMAVLVTGVWAVAAAISSAVKKRGAVKAVGGLA